MQTILKRDIGYYLYKLGINYFDYGIVRQGNKKVYDYYKCDKITESQKIKLLKIIPNVIFKKSGLTYAPEIVSNMVLIPVGKIPTNIKQGNKWVNVE